MSKKPKFITIENIPDWAANWFAYRDDSGLSDDDKFLVKEFEKRLAAEGLRLVAPICGTENEFCSCPEFGGGCSTTDWSAQEV